MTSRFYLPRRLESIDRAFTESELLAADNFIVVLAEPGGGKTELLTSLARQVGAIATTANLFAYVGADSRNCPLVIDAFDELSKVDQAGIFKLLANVKKVDPTSVIVSSRSSEWNSAVTNAFKEFLGHLPLVVRLREFEEWEQRAIFDSHVPGEDFEKFKAEVSRFDLEALLPNPQFLKLFTDAYIESERHFPDKRSIFTLAAERLAREANDRVTRVSSAPSAPQRLALASEVFAKILLSGAEGVGTSEANENRMYPMISAVSKDGSAAGSILATKLFKPGDSADRHRPVHKIVAEFCAADYLTKRIVDQTDPLTLSKCLPILAPNATVRDELRGLLGWMASLGNQQIEEVLIELDPYAVLANGDPSQLSSSSKRLLVRRLKDVESKDPYFRRADLWRRFSVAGFFSPEVLEEIRPLLTAGEDGHLRGLILELLAGSPAVDQLGSELRGLLLSPSESEGMRLLAARCLLEGPNADGHAEMAALLSEATQTALKIVAEMIEIVGLANVERTFLADFLRACAALYPGRDRHLDREIGGRYFVKRLIAGFDRDTAEWLLDDLSTDIACRCEKNTFECDCLVGISKVVGQLLDSYFDRAVTAFDPRRLWRWMGNLNYLHHRDAKQSRAVQFLQENNELRREIMVQVLGALTDRDQIRDTSIRRFGWHCHSGLKYRVGDAEYLSSFAFESENPTLWASFIVDHQFSRSGRDHSADEMRRTMRGHALAKPSFMREWAKAKRAAAQFERDHGLRKLHFDRRMLRRERRQQEIRQKNISYVRSNRELVEGGRHWTLLLRFAELTLMQPDRMEQEFGEETIVRTALKNCLDFIAPHVPNMHRLAELQCSSQSAYAEMILYAACLEIMRDAGSLDGVDVTLLRALRTNISMGYSAVSAEDRAKLAAEVDRLVFTDEAAIESFLRQYIEPQLSQVTCIHAQVWMLRSEEVFRGFRATLSLEWLERFRDAALETLDVLFETAAQYGDRSALIEIVRIRCSDLAAIAADETAEKDTDQRRRFWYVRAFAFGNGKPDQYWNWLKADESTVHVLCELYAKLNRGDRPYWPGLSSTKIELILDAFFEKWPKVELPNHWGTESPLGERIYRFLSEIIWSISSDQSDEAIPVLNRLLADRRFVDLHRSLRSILSAQIRAAALRDFEPPTPQEIMDLLDRDEVVTVEGLRELVIQELKGFQYSISGGEFNSAARFYEKGEHLDEEQCTEIIAERLNLRLQPQNITVTPEHQLKAEKRSDFTVAKLIGGRRRLLVTEVKGQWHKELYSAASEQLSERYAIHPDAEQQGIYLVLWFGPDETVAARRLHAIGSAQELKISIVEKLPPQLMGLIDVFVLDVSRL